MCNTIRLSRLGKKNQPIYRIVVVPSQHKRNCPTLDILGQYNPSVKPPSFIIDENKLNQWIKKGALVSDGLRKLLKNK